MCYCCFIFTVSKKFEIPILDLKVYDDLNTEVDEDAFEFLVKKPDLGVLEVRLPQGPDPEGELLINLLSYNTHSLANINVTCCCTLFQGTHCNATWIILIQLVMYFFIYT